MTEDFPEQYRAYNLWGATFDASPENFMLWRQREELWQLVSGLMDESGSGWSELSEWWTEHVDHSGS